MNAGAIVFSLLMQGAQVFKKDAAEADAAAKKLGDAAEQAAPKAKKLGDEVDKTGTAAKEAKDPLEQVAQAKKRAAEQAENAANKTALLGGKFSDLSKDGLAAATTVGAAMLGIGTAIALVGGLAVSKFSEFEVATDRTAAATMASAGEQRELGKAALQAGADSVFSASEAANAQTELAKAGLTVNDILSGGLNGSLALAAAGELDVARAAEVASITLKQFHLEGDQAGRVADVLAAGAGKAVGSVDDLANGLKFVGPVAQSMNVSLEESVGVLALFAKNGIIGEQGGTAFRGMLSSLTSPSAAARKEIERLGINLYDSAGRFLGVENAAGQLKGAYGGLTDQARDASLGILFGNEQITAARVLYQAGAEGVREMTTAVSENGYATEQAAALTDNLAGDVERLGGSIDTALIQTGAPANDILREMVQGLTFLTDAAGNLPAPVISSGLALGAAAVSIALVGGGALVAIPRIVEMQAAMTKLGLSGTGVKVGIAAAGTALTVFTLIIGAAISEQAQMKSRVDELAASLDQQTGAITENTRASQQKRLQDEGVFDAAKQAGIGLDIVTDAALGNKDAIEQVNAAAGAYLDEGGRGVTDLLSGQSFVYDKLTDNVRVAYQELDKGKGVWRNSKEAADGNTGAVEDSAEAYLAANDQATAFVDTLTQLIDKINESNGVGQDAVSSNAVYQASLQEVRETIAQAKAGVEGYSTSVDESTVAGSANAQMFGDLADKSQAAALAQLKLDGDTNKYYASVNAGRQSLYDQILALTGNADAAQALTDKVYAIPSKAEVETVVRTASALRTIDDFIAQMGQKVGVINFRANLPDVNGGASGNGRMGTFANGGVVDYFAGGGFSRERHVAQIARAGTMRVWAEPETGGEAYIPLAPSKRQRSLDIWHETGRRLGVENYADGGFSRGGGSLASYSTPNIYVQNPFTGEYLLAQVRTVAEGVTQGALDDEADIAKRGRRL